MGVIAILPMVAFFGTGVLSKDDFNSFLWHVVMLAMGGLALGEAVKSSGLLQTITHGIQNLVQVCSQASHPAHCRKQDSDLPASTSARFITATFSWLLNTLTQNCTLYTSQHLPQEDHPLCIDFGIGAPLIKCIINCFH